MWLPVIPGPYLTDFASQQMQEVQPSDLDEKGRGKLGKEMVLVLLKKMALEGYQMPDPWPSKPGDRGKDWSENNRCRSSETRIVKCDKMMNKDHQVCLLPSIPFHTVA